MFDRPWLLLLIAVTVIAALFRQPAALALPVFVFLLIGFARWWRRHALDRVTYSRHLSYSHVFPGEPVDLTLEARNDKRLPVPWLIVSDTLPPQIAVGDANPAETPARAPIAATMTHSFVLRGGARARVRLRLSATERGYYPIGPADLRSGDPFSIVDATRHDESQTWLSVYPKLIPLAELGLPAKDLFGEQRARQRMFEDPSRTMGVRDYQPSDSFRSIHWKATARQGALQTRVYEHTVNTAIMICLNVATSPNAWQGVRHDRLEHAISLCASIAYDGIERGFAVGVAVNCAVPRVARSISVPPGRSPDQLMRVLEALSAVTHYVVTPFENFLLRESPKLAWGATMIPVTPLVTPAILVAATQLRAAGRRVALVSIDPQPLPPLKGVLTYHLPMPGDKESTHG